LKTSRSFSKGTLIVTLALCAVIAVGVPIYRYSLPEPEQCALCELAHRCHAPALMNLATGEILEMRVYEPDPIRPWELAEEQRTGYFHISDGAGLRGWCDGGIAAHAELRVNKTLQELRKASQENITTERGIYLRLCRSIQVEGAFGLLKTDFGFRRFLTRGKANVRTELFLLALAFDLKKLWMKRENGRLKTHLSQLDSA